MNRIKQKFGEHSHPNAATIDHAIPQADGGSDMRENLRLAHYRCNNERADPLPHDGWLDEHPALAAAASKPTAAGLIAAAIQRTRGQESEI
jgi:5-methylcytosine-specific restriction endonuclease McrA